MKPSELLKEKGWIQGSFHTKDGYCLMGALDKCFDDGEEYHFAQWKLKHYLKKSVAVWNDTPGRTKKQAIAALKAVGL